MNQEIAKREEEARQLRKETAHKQAIQQLANSAENFKLLVSGVRGYIKESKEFPGPYELQSFTNEMLDKSNFKDSLVISYLNESHIFVYSFTRRSVNQNNLIGLDVSTIRDAEEIQFLENAMNDQELHFNYPINLVEGWLGIPVVFGVENEGESIGYIAAIVNIRTILNAIYESDINEEFVYKFKTDKGDIFDRNAIYDGSKIYNEKKDQLFYRRFEMSDEFITSKINIQGIGIEIGTAYRQIASPNMLRITFVFSLFTLILIVLIYVIWNYRNEKKAELELRISNEQIAKQNASLEFQKREVADLLENLGDGVFELDKDGRCIYVNNRMCEMLNMDRDEVLNTSIWDMIHSEDVPYMKSYYGSVFKLKINNCLYEYRLKVKNQPPLWVEQSTTMQYEEDEMVKLRSIARDISENKKLKKELEEKESLYQLVSENSSDLIALHEVDGTYKYASPASKDLVGYEQSELIGKNPYDFIHPDDIERLKDGAHQETLNGHAISEFQYRFKRKDGAYVWLESYTKPIYNEQGEIISIQTSSRDISIKKIEREQLEIAKKKAEEASAAKADFLSMMSHEIRTPLNGIVGTTHLLLNKSPTEGQLSHLKVLEQSSNNLMAIVNDILDFNKIEEGKILISSSSFNLKELIESIYKNYKIQGDEKGVSVVMEYDSLLSNYYHSDSMRINQVIHNLMSNALKFTFKGSVKLSVSKNNSHDNFDEILFSIKDTGIGIPIEKQNEIFEVFTQADKTTTREFGGSGLGLSITKRILEFMNSDIVLESTFDEGSEFTFKLVLQRTNSVSTQNKNTSNNADFQPLNAKILLVDDNEFNRIIAKDFLASWGCSVLEAENGVEALHILTDQTVDLILLDLQMPIMDGYETIKAIRSHQNTFIKHMPVIALTAAAMGDVESKVYQSGMDGFITKPFHPSDFYQKIQIHIKKSDDENTNTERAIVLDKLQMTLGKNEDGLEKYFHIFVETLSEESVTLHNYIKDKNLTGIKAYSHKVKSSLHLGGLIDLSAQAESLEQMIVKQMPSEMIVEKSLIHHKEIVRTLQKLMFNEE